MVTLGVNSGGVSVGTLGDGAGQSGWSAPAGASCGVFGVTAVGGFSVTFEKMRESVCMVANFLSPSVANGVGVRCRLDHTMATLGVNAGEVSVGTLGDGAGKSVWSAPAGASRGVFGVPAVGGFSANFEKMRKSVCMAANCSSPSVAKGVGVGCKRDSDNARAAVLAALVELLAGTGQSCGKNSTILAMLSARVRGM